LGADVLTVGERHGLAPDAALPARDLLLDQDAAGEHLAALLDRDVAGCELLRVKYRIGESLRVTYRLVADSGRELLTVRAFRPGESGSAYRKAAGPGVWHDPALDAVWWAFPADRRLRGLADLLSPGPELAALAPGWVAGELAEYSPERAATFRLADAAGMAVGYAKAYAPGTVDVVERSGRYARIAAVLAAGGAAGGFAAPVPLGRSEARTVLVLQPMPGLEWGRLAGPALAAAMGRLGSAIATLHAAGRQAAAGLPRFGRLDVRRVVHSAHLVAVARPDVSAAAVRLADRLADGPPPGGPQVALHGDCHPRNALLAGDSIALIDLDQAGVGPAAADLGSLIARLHADGDTGAMRSAFLSGYQAVRPLPPERSLRWHTAAALVAERGVRAVNRVHLPTLDRLPQLLETADDVLLNGVGP
jgi:hypothetical protein